MTTILQRHLYSANFVVEQKKSIKLTGQPTKYNFHQYEIPNASELRNENNIT